MRFNSIEDVYDAVRGAQRRRLAVVKAADKTVLETVAASRELGLADAVLIDNQAQLARAAEEAGISLEGFRIVHVPDSAEAARTGVALVKNGEADVLMKGFLETRDFMHAVVATGTGLKLENRMITSILAVELKEQKRFLFLTDIGFVPAPDLEGKRQILFNAVDVLHALGCPEPKVAVICATETVNPKMPATLDAQALQAQNEAGEITGCRVAGPISFDIATSERAARHKKYANPVGGHADILLMPNLETGNVAAKTFDLFTEHDSVSIVAGASAPIVFTSRGNSMREKLNAVAFAVQLVK